MKQVIKYDIREITLKELLGIVIPSTPRLILATLLLAMVSSCLPEQIINLWDSSFKELFNITITLLMSPIAKLAEILSSPNII